MDDQSITVGDLMDLLTDALELRTLTLDTPIRFAYQRSYPLAGPVECFKAVQDTVTGEPVLWVAADQATEYLTGFVAEKIGWDK